MSLVNVLCPNGRREQVKVQSNTKILDIIEEVCKKQGLDSNEYDVIFQRRHLDIGLTLRLAGVPNNAQFELKKLEAPRKFEDVTIAFQLDDGTRLNPHPFNPLQTLFELIEFFSKSSDFLKTNPNQPDMYPVCSYMNEQVIGMYQFKHTTLKDLGLINGRGIIRFNFKSIDKDEFEKLNDEFQSKIEKKLKLEEAFKIKQHQQKQQQQIEENSFPKNSIEQNSSSQLVSKVSTDSIEKKPRLDESKLKSGKMLIFQLKPRFAIVT